MSSTIPIRLLLIDDRIWQTSASTRGFKARPALVIRIGSKAAFISVQIVGLDFRSRLGLYDARRSRCSGCHRRATEGVRPTNLNAIAAIDQSPLSGPPIHLSTEILSVALGSYARFPICDPIAPISRLMRLQLRQKSSQSCPTWQLDWNTSESDRIAEFQQAGLHSPGCGAGKRGTGSVRHT